jgi:enamine deaminase RidA (YjgF/YER057c/UK114 family)
VIISGTASIDSNGKIVHERNVMLQFDRTLQNFHALLSKAGAGFEDVAMLIIYVRDPADLPLARQQIHNRFPGIPLEVVVAPVCRPGWLIEIEGKAIIPNHDAGLPAF